MDSTEFNTASGSAAAPIVSATGTSSQQPIWNPVEQRTIVRRIESFVLVDSDPDQLELISDYLRIEGFNRILTLDRTDHAIEKIRQHHPDIIFLSWRMPEVGGSEILQAIRRDPEISTSLVITLNDWNAPETRAHAIEAGADDCLNKPVLPTELKFQTERAIEHRRAKRKLAKLPGQLELTIKSHTEELLKSKSEAILCLARALEYRDDPSGNHVIRVGRYAAIIASELGFPKPAVELIEQAAQLHDVGKIGVPDSILQKRGKLDSQEFARMVRHCSIGRQIICPTVDSQAGNDRSQIDFTKQDFATPHSPVLRMAALIVETHHEKWDGSGYPHSLKGEEIPLPGRIVAVADVFDALASQRPYKVAYPIDKCLSILGKSRGKHFDPRVLDAFCARKDEILAVHRQLGDPIDPEPTEDSVTTIEASRDGRN